MFDERKVQMELAGRTLTFSTGKNSKTIMWSCNGSIWRYCFTKYSK